MRKPRRGGRSGAEEGAAAVELALVFPLLIVLLIGIVEFGRMFAAHTAITTASREAARYGSANGPSSNGVAQFTDCTEIRQAAKARVVMADLTDSDISVTFDNGPSTSVIASCDGVPAYPTTANITTGTRIVVEVTYQFDTAVPILPASMTNAGLSARDSRTIFRGATP